MPTRRLAKTKYLLQTDGVHAAVRQLSSLLWLHLRLKAMNHKKSAELDGCTFGVQTIPNSYTKLGLLNGRYELPERRAIQRHLKRDLPVIELGGALGVVACITNKLLAHPKDHVVVEANPLAVRQLILNKTSNHCEFEIVNCALAYGVDSVTFCPRVEMDATSIESDGSGLDSTEQAVTVPTVQLGRLLSEHGFRRFCLVCDIEGKEYDLICHELEVLREADVIILETHPLLIGEDKNQFLINSLIDVGFRIVEHDGSVITLEQTVYDILP
jgi:FkbM family methyltransferase